MRALILGLTLVALAACAGPATPAAISAAQGVASDHLVTLSVRAQSGTPPAVVRAARHISGDLMAAHPPARAVWVRSTWAGWSRLDGQPLSPSGENPTAAIYIVALLAHAPMTCRGCKPVSVVRGRYAYAAVAMRGRGDGELQVSNSRANLASLGLVRVAFAAI